jgi:hypothetical protein
MLVEEATKRDHAVSLHDLEMEDINDVWSTFRLPIPIPDKGRPQNHNNNQNEWLLQVVDQLRLLQTMKEQYSNPNDGTRYRSSKHQRMKGQINLALSGQARIEQTFPYSHQMTNNDDTTRIDYGGTHQPVFYENAHRLVQTMREETEDICNKFHEWLSRNPEQQHINENIIANIFFAPLEPVVTQDEPLDEFSDEGDGNENNSIDDDEDLNHMDNESPVSTQKRAQSTTRKVIPTSRQLRNQRNEDIDPVEFQKQQQELLEEELSSMAARLKSSTLAMNATLQTQTKDLESMEDIAQANLDNVSSTTKKVEQRLAKKKGWKKRIATWSMIFTVIGMWVLCFMIMRTVPKRKVGKLRVVGLKSWKRFITEKTGQLKGRLDMLLNGKSFDFNWEQSKATNERERQRHKQQQRQQNTQSQECEILPDGSQVCRDRERYDNPDAKAQQLLAERKQRRIEENMANARTVVAIDPADIPDEAEVEEDENVECIPPTPAMKELQKSLKGMENARNNLAKSFESSPEGSEKRKSLLNSLEILHSEFQRFMTILESAQNTAITAYWDDRQQDAMQGVPFCATDTDKAELEQNQVAWAALSELMKAEEDRLRKAQEEEEEEEEAKLRKEAEDARLQREAAAEARKKAEEEALEARKKAQEEAAAAKRKAEEGAAAEARKKAEEEVLAARKKAEEEAAAEARKKAEEEAAAAKRKAEEEAAAEARKKAEEEVLAARKKAQEEAAAEARQKAEEEALEASKKSQEEAAAAKRKAEEEAAAEARKKAEEEALAARKKAEEEAAAEARKKAEEEALEASKKSQEEAAAAKRKAEEGAAAEARQKAEEEALAARKKAEEEAAAEARKKAEEEAAAAKRKAEEEAAAEASKKAEEEAAAEARKKAQEEAATEAMKKAEEEAAAAKRKAEEEAAAEARRKADEEALESRKKAEEEAAAAKRKAEEEAAAEARKKAEEEAAAAAAVAAHEEAKKAEEEATEAKKAEERLRKQAEEIEMAKEVRERNRPAALRKKVQIEARKAQAAAKELEVEGFRASDLRFAASRGQNDLLAYYISEMPVWIDASDAGGWRPLHEAARAGNLVGIELLISAGCDISSRTGRSGNGGTALWWAIQRYGESHDVVELLRFHNALEAGPDKR